MTKWIKQQQDPSQCCLQDTFDVRIHTEWQVRDGKMYSMQMETKESLGFTLDKTDFKTKKTLREKEEHCIMIKESVVFLRFYLFI